MAFPLLYKSITSFSCNALATEYEHIKEAETQHRSITTTTICNNTLVYWKTTASCGVSTTSSSLTLSTSKSLYIHVGHPPVHANIFNHLKASPGRWLFTLLFITRTERYVKFLQRLSFALLVHTLDTRALNYQALEGVKNLT